MIALYFTAEPNVAEDFMKLAEEWGKEEEERERRNMKHSSKPYNPKLANVFFMSGMIEAWGRGFDKIKEDCARYDGPMPEYNISKSGVMVLCKACDRYLKLLSGGENNSLISNERIDERKAMVMVNPSDKIMGRESVSILDPRSF